MLAAPIEARFAVDRAMGRIGTHIVARLNLTALEDMAQLAISIDTNGCMAVVSPATPKTVDHVRKGQKIVASAKFKLTQLTPCNVIAEVVTYSDSKNRFGSVYGVTVNKVPTGPSPELRKGKTLKGEPTIEAPAAK